MFALRSKSPAKRFARCPQPRPFRHLSESLVLRLGCHFGRDRYFGLRPTSPGRLRPQLLRHSPYTKPKHNCLGFFYVWMDCVPLRSKVVLGKRFARCPQPRPFLPLIRKPCSLPLSSFLDRYQVFNQRVPVTGELCHFFRDALLVRELGFSHLNHCVPLFEPVIYEFC